MTTLSPQHSSSTEPTALPQAPERAHLANGNSAHEPASQRRTSTDSACFICSDTLAPQDAFILTVAHSNVQELSKNVHAPCMAGWIAAEQRRITQEEHPRHPFALHPLTKNPLPPPAIFAPDFDRIEERQGRSLTAQERSKIEETCQQANNTAAECAQTSDNTMRVVAPSRQTPRWEPVARWESAMDLEAAVRTRQRGRRSSSHRGDCTCTLPIGPKTAFFGSAVLMMGAGAGAAVGITKTVSNPTMSPGLAAYVGIVVGGAAWAIVWTLACAIARSRAW